MDREDVIRQKRRNQRQSKQNFRNERLINRVAWCRARNKKDPEAPTGCGDSEVMEEPQGEQFHKGAANSRIWLTKV